MTGAVYEFTAISMAATSAALAQRANGGAWDDPISQRTSAAIAGCLLVAGLGFLILGKVS